MLTLSRQISNSNYELQSSGAVLLTVRGSHTNSAGLVILFQTASKNGGPHFFGGGKKIFIVSKQKNRQKIQKIDIYNIHKLYTKKNNNNQHTT